MQFCDSEASGAKGVEVAINGPIGHIKLIGQVVDAVMCIACEQLHQAQHSLQLRLIHK
jgi:hypothetical protein